ncbi:DUF1778 domain-containing protein [Microcoleus sp. B7-D4]|uniref:DUF1778 domain-containing protein n=1 Tax=Microcoleus sp. B7-D4 TaxID=2818696 RepID=UPI002FD71E32
MARANAIPKQAEDRLSIRANAAQKSILKRAADKKRMNLSQFVMQVALSEAEEILQDDPALVISAEDYAWVCQVMDAPPRELPRLREAMQQKPVWDA